MVTFQDSQVGLLECFLSCGELPVLKALGEADAIVSAVGPFWDLLGVWVPELFYKGFVVVFMRSYSSFIGVS